MIAVIYARYSSHRQRDASIEDQIRVCTAKAEENGDTIIKVYADKAISGKTDDRKEFQKMLKDSAKGAFERVYIYKTDRFARNRYDSATSRHKLKKNGVELVCAAESIPEGAEGILFEAVLEGMAEYYSASLAENVSRGMYGNALKCHHNGIKVYGFTNNPDGSVSINPEQAAVVTKIFELYASGHTVREIKDAIYPAKTARGKEFATSTIMDMLRNDKYIGVYRFADVVTPGGLPQIIPDNLWDKVQAHLKSNVRRRSGNTKMNYYLTGALFDDDGNHFRGTSGTSKNGERYYYYECPKTNTRYNKELLEARVADMIMSLVESDGVQDRVVDMVIKGQEEALADEFDYYDALKKQLEKNERDHKRAVELLLELDDDVIREKITELKAEHDRLSYELARTKEPIKLTKEHVKFWLQKMSEGMSDGVVITSFLDRVLINNENDIRVFIKMPDQSGAPMSCSYSSELVGPPGFEPRTKGL